MAANRKPKGDKFYDLFSLDMQRVLIDEIKAWFGKLAPVPLSAENLAHLKSYEESLASQRIKKGLYILHHPKGEVSYVGKTDGSLYTRLMDHFEKISGRMNILPGEVGFRCLYLDENWSASAHEEQLIQEFKGEGVCSWNYSGFGIHDPGRHRDTTQLNAQHFDRMFPVNPDIPVNAFSKSETIAESLSALKRELPYLLRYQDFRKPPKDYGQRVDLTRMKNPTAKNVLYAIADVLGGKWQATFLYGYAILYRENKDYGPDCRQCFKIGGKPENQL